MDLIPAIDLLEGNAVRLVQGDYERRAASVEDPEQLVSAWASAGASWLHVVDLGGARAGRPMDLPLATSLAAAARAARPELRVELGGGLRSEAAIEAAFEAGIDVAVLGTAALEDRALLDRCVERWPGRVAVSIDVRGERIAVDGWTRSAARDAVNLAADLGGAGVAHLVVTDVERDGTRGGPNRELLARMRRAAPTTRLIAAGGVGTTGDLRELAELGIDGAIVGLALVDGSLRIEDAVAAAGAPVPLG